MKIKEIKVYQVNYKLLDNRYSWSRGLYVEKFLSTIVEISTDEGISGYGEVCPLGSAYMDAYANGVASGIKELGPGLIGEDPTQIKKINSTMDYLLGGHNYVKSPVDIACWDILGKVNDSPVVTLLGGKMVNKFPLYRAIPQSRPERMRDDVIKYKNAGYKKFQLKVGGEPDEDIKRIIEVYKSLDPDDDLVADANTGWITRGALRVVNAVKDMDVYIEQPCKSLDECLTVRQHTNLPFVIDELITGVHPLIDAYKKNAMDNVNIKLSRVGGLTKAKLLRDICESLGIAMTLEDSWGGDITTAAISAIAGSTNLEHYFSSTDFNSYNDLSICENPIKSVNGFINVSGQPGLGVDVNKKLLGEPVLIVK